MKKILITIIYLMTSTQLFAKPITTKDIKGVWQLTEFYLVDDQGNQTDWCQGSFGTITYTSKHMSVSINCKSDAAKKVFYSCLMQFKNGNVFHIVKNYHDIQLKKIFKRKVIMPENNKLILEGPFGSSGKVIVKWDRIEN